MNEYEFYEIYIALIFSFIATIVIAGGHNLCFLCFYAGQDANDHLVDPIELETRFRLAGASIR